MIDQNYVSFCKLDIDIHRYAVKYKLFHILAEIDI